MSNSEDFELKISSRPDGYVVELENSPAGRTSSEHYAPLAEIDMDSFVSQLYGESADESDTHAFLRSSGTQMFRSLFSGEIGGFYKSSLDRVHRNEISGLRILLRLGDAPQLLNLPWEYLFDEVNEQFLALSPRTQLIRYVDLPRPIHVPAIKPPVRLLIMAASPPELAEINIAEEKARISRALHDVAQKGLVEIESLSSASLPALQQRLRDEPPIHLLHFIGHGFWDPNSQSGTLVGETVASNQTAKKKASMIDARGLATLLQSTGSLRLVVLNACEGARSGSNSIFASVAGSLVQQGLPAVVAMQLPISEGSASLFVCEFYTVLFRNHSIEDAVCQARRSIFSANRPDWGVPVLYSQVAEGRLFDWQANSSDISSNLPRALDAFVSRIPYKFENRKRDFEAISFALKGHPYLHVYGPSGVGKTYLAAMLLERYYSGDRKAYLNFGNREFSSQARRTESLLAEIERQLFPAQTESASTTEEICARLARGLKETPGHGIVILDEVDLMVSDVRRQLREKIFPLLQTEINDPTKYIRFLTIAQHDKVDGFQGYGAVNFEYYRLKEFRAVLRDLSTYKGLIQQALRRHGNSNLDPHNAAEGERIERWARELYELTWGHPGAIEVVLESVGVLTSFSHANAFESQRKFLCQDELQPLVRQHIESVVHNNNDAEAFHDLLVFRYMSHGVLKQLLREVQYKNDWQKLASISQRSDIEGGRTSPLWQRLIGTSLLEESDDRTFPSRITPIWRKIANTILLEVDPKRYQRMHQDAGATFKHFVFSDKIQDNSFRIACLREFFYHRSQQVCLDSNELRDDCAGEIGSTLEEFLLFLASHDPDKTLYTDYLDRLDKVFEDDELREELERIGQPGLVQQLRQSIDRRRRGYER